MLPLLFKVAIDIVKIDEIEAYTESLYEKYSKESKAIEELLNSIKSIPNVPMELLCKYYIRAYTAESGFYRDINSNLRKGKKENYLTFIKVLYEGIRLKALPLGTNHELYRGSMISKEEIKIINDYINKKIENLPGAIVFSKSFLSFSKKRAIAENFLNSIDNNNILPKVLYILKKDDSIDYSLSTNGDIEEISLLPYEKEVLFFSFSTFEIQSINEIQKGKMYEINLLYLGKYLKEIENDKNIIGKENSIPNCEFKKQIIEMGLIKKQNINNTKQIINEYKEYKKTIPKNIFIKNDKYNNNISTYNNKDTNSLINLNYIGNWKKVDAVMIIYQKTLALVTKIFVVSMKIENLMNTKIIIIA